MRFGRIIGAVERAFHAVYTKLNWISYIFISAIILIVVANVAGRFFLHKPLLGASELVEVLIVIFVFAAIPYTASQRGHVQVDLVLGHLSRRAQAVLGSITAFLGFAITAIITYQSSILAISFIKDKRQVTDLLDIPYAPFRVFLSLGFLLFCLILLVHVFRPLPTEEKQESDLSK